MKFILFVEGPTERMSLPEFLKRWLDKRLNRAVGIKPVGFGGWAELWREAPKKARLYLGGRDREDIAGVISLLDLYGPNVYPLDRKTAEDRYSWAKAEMEERVGHHKFRQFFAVHETEAWLLSQPTIFPAAVSSSFPKKIAKPESVNFNEPPAKLLDRVYRNKLRRSYKKVTNGRTLFEKLDPDTACNSCSRLKELLDEMLQMAGTASQ